MGSQWPACHKAFLENNLKLKQLSYIQMAFLSISSLALADLGGGNVIEQERKPGEQATPRAKSCVFPLETLNVLLLFSFFKCVSLSSRGKLGP